MFDIGFIEWFAILLCVILFVKPEDLPELFRFLGKMYGQVMRVSRVFLDELNRKT